MLPDIKVNVRADTKQAEAALGRVQKSVGGVATAAKPATTAMGRLGSVTGQQRFIINNTSNQLGDMAVQLSMGTDAMRVMGFQMPQLLGGFAAMGGAMGTVLPILGAVAAIGFPIAAAFIAMGGGSRGLKKDVDGLGESVGAYRDIAQDTLGRTIDLSAGFGHLSGSALMANQAIMALAKARGLNDINIASQSLVDQWKENERDLAVSARQVAAMFDLTGVFTSYNSLMAGVKDATKEFADELQNLSNPNLSMEGRVTAMEKVLGLYQILSEANGEITNEEADQIALMGQLLAKMRDFAAITKEVEGNTKRSSDNLRNMSIANLMAATTGGGRGADPRAFGGGGAGQTFAEWNKEFGRKGAKGPDIAKQYERLRGALDPVFRATADLSNAQETLNKALAQGKISQEEYNVTLELAQGKFDRVTGAVMDMGSVFDTIESSMENAFMSMIDGTKSAEDAFRSMAVEIIKELYRVLVVQQLVGAFSSTTGQGSGIMGFLGNLLSFEGGGSTGSGSRSGGIDGRGGSLAIVHPQETIIDHTKAANNNGGMGGATIVHQTINVDAGVSQTVRAEMISMLPQFKEQTIQAVTDSNRRSARA